MSKSADADIETKENGGTLPDEHDAPRMVVNPEIQNIIAEKVLAEAVANEREPSGRLSAGKLGWPLQWQMLHYFRVPPRPLDEYTLRKFQRGKDVEDRIVSWLEPEQKQLEVEYRGVVGFVDLIRNGIPVEAKSVTNMAFKHIMREGVKRGHRLQGMLYAKALNVPEFIVAYVASDDYRVLAFQEQVTDEVDLIVNLYEEQKSLREVPVFKAEEKWHALPEYSVYPEWKDLDAAQVEEKLRAFLSNTAGMEVAL